MLPFFHKQPENSAQGAKIVMESYNEMESKAVEKLFADSLSNYMTAKVKVYNRIEKFDLKYVAVYLELKENFLENEMSFRGIENVSKRLVYTQFPKNTFVGQVKFVYMTPRSIQSRVISLELDEKKYGQPLTRGKKHWGLNADMQVFSTLLILSSQLSAARPGK